MSCSGPTSDTATHGLPDSKNRYKENNMTRQEMIADCIAYYQHCSSSDQGAYPIKDMPDYNGMTDDQLKTIMMFDGH